MRNSGYRSTHIRVFAVGVLKAHCHADELESKHHLAASEVEDAFIPADATGIGDMPATRTVRRALKTQH
jgi:hypothetical protein